MNNGQLTALLTTVLDMVGDNRAASGRILKSFALAQALTAEGEFCNDDKALVSAAAILHVLNEQPTNDDSDSQPMVLAGYMTQLLQSLYLPQYEVATITALIDMQNHGPEITNPLHRQLIDLHTIVTLDEENADLERVSAALEKMTNESAKRRLRLMFGIK